MIYFQLITEAASERLQQARSGYNKPEAATTGGNMAGIYWKNGKAYPIPYGREDGKQFQTRSYTYEPCEKCGGKVYYTRTGTCKICAMHDACDLHGYAIGIMSFCDYPPEYGGGIETMFDSRDHLGPVGNREVTAEYKQKILDLIALVGEPVATSMRKAVKQGSKLWITAEPCHIKGHFGIRTLDNKCYFCELERNQPSPRQLAIGAGKTRYMPLTPCPKCGKIAEKYVHNGSCTGCKPAKTENRQESPDTIMMRASPDLIISRKDARALGMKVYRTGKPCRRGHKGFRYISTNSCIDCLRGK